MKEKEINKMGIILAIGLAMIFVGLFVLITSYIIIVNSYYLYMSGKKSKKMYKKILGIVIIIIGIAVSIGAFVLFFYGINLSFQIIGHKG